VLVTLLLLWVVVVPVLTLAGMYVITGVLGRRQRAHDKHLVGLAGASARRLTTRLHRPVRAAHAAHAARTRDHALQR
jgi:hypothetical protein